jgi:glycosyltransferase involved in cell wall biosynthesis
VRTELASTNSGGPVISVVIPMRDEAEMVPILFAQLIPVLDSIGEIYEIVCVNDGGSDETLIRLLDARSNRAEIKIVDLSRGFGKDAAMMAGLDRASGQALVIMDADLQDPPDIIPEMVARWRNGDEVVYGARRSRGRDGFFKRLTAGAFYAVFNRISDVPIAPDAGDFRLMDRKVLDALQKIPESARFTKGMFAWIGFRQAGVSYDRPARSAGTSKWSYVRLARFALDGLFSFSDIPLRIWTWLGLAIALASISYASFLVVRTIVQGVDVPGYASLMVTVLFLGGIQLLSVGVLGKYIGRIFSETKRRPLYVVRRTHGIETNSGTKPDRAGDR